MKKRKGIRLSTAFFLIVAASFLSAVGTYYYVSSVVNDLGSNQQMYQKLDILNQAVSRNYILSIDAVSGYDDIVDGIASGYVDGLGDENSYYLNEKNYAVSSVSSDASGYGIGIRYTFDTDTGGIGVVFVKVNSPAEVAGLKTDDVIVCINGIYVTETGYRKACQSLNGTEGSVVSLTVIRPGESDLISIDVTRTSFVPMTVEYRLVESNIGYIYINEFASSTLTDFNTAVDDLVAKGAKGFIIDVRFNSAGDFDSAVDVADRIVPSGLLASVREASSSDLIYHFSDEKNLGYPVVVIQNGETAGASEVFAAALRDTESAVTVGETTAGVGVGQRTISLSDGTAVVLSSYEYVTPSGERFNGNGIAPNYSVSLDEEKTERFSELSVDEDDQLSVAVSQLKILMGMQ